MAVSLKNQAALVLGASSGIGRACAVALARSGANVVASARREERLRDLQTELRGEGATVEVEVADTSDARAMSRVADSTFRAFGKIDLLVYASGTNTPDRSMERLKPEIW